MNRQCRYGTGAKVKKSLPAFLTGLNYRRIPTICCHAGPRERSFAFQCFGDPIDNGARPVVWVNKMNADPAGSKPLIKSFKTQIRSLLKWLPALFYTNNYIVLCLPSVCARTPCENGVRGSNMFPLCTGTDSDKRGGDVRP